MKIARSIPYLKILSSTPANKRRSVLNAFPSYVIDDISELIYNIVRGKTNIPNKKLKSLRKHRAKLLKLVNARTKFQRRKIVQSGGALPVLPILEKVAWGLAPLALQKLWNYWFGGSKKKKENEQN